MSPISNLKVSFQFRENINAAPVRTYDLPRIFLQSISNHMSGSMYWKDNDIIPSEEDDLIDNGVESTKYS